MQFKNLTNDIIPVKNNTLIQNQQIIACSDFKGKVDSITGIISKFMYIDKINTLTGKSETPTIRIICGVECKDKCINIK